MQQHSSLSYFVLKKLISAVGIISPVFEEEQQDEGEEKVRPDALKQRDILSIIKHENMKNSAYGDSNKQIPIACTL